MVLDVFLVEEDLPLQVAHFDKIAIGNPYEPDAGADKRFREHGAERSATTEKHAAREQLPLPRFAEFRKENLFAVAFEVGLHDMRSVKAPVETAHLRIG